jgi:hypothetical protein
VETGRSISTTTPVPPRLDKSARIADGRKQDLRGREQRAVHIASNEEREGNDFRFFFRSGFTIQMSFLPPLYGPAVTLGYPRACWSGGRCLRYATSAEVVAAVE